MPRRLTTLLVTWASVLGSCAFAADLPPRPTVGLQHDVRFSDYSSLSRNTEILRRLLSPLAAETANLKLAQTGETLSEQSIDLANERFVIYAPPSAPANGYGLMVFVPPWNEAKMPSGWKPVLDRYCVIFVSAARSGNDMNVLARREPLALLEVKNIADRYVIDPSRIYIAGFSGGSRIAMRLAMAFPDVFKGAFLNAGSDPVGDPGPPPPPAELMALFQRSTRLFYATGEEDEANLSLDGESAASMGEFCVQNIDTKAMPRIGHEAADGDVLARALDAFLRMSEPDPARLAACRSKIQARLDAAFQGVAAALSAGNTKAARKELLGIDATYGGLAAPRVIDLARRCRCGLLDKAPNAPAKGLD